MSSRGTPSDPRLLDAGLARRVMVEGDDRPVSVGSLIERRAVVLLGDPGLGKSVSMKAVARMAGGYFRTVRGFLVDGGRTSQTGPVFLDGLDEAMALRPGGSALDDVARLLMASHPQRFWLSCRPADWIQAGGRALLEEQMPSGLTIGHLLPLDEDEIAAAIRTGGLDPEVVAGSMRQAGLLPLLGNPETLRLVLEVFASGGAPTSRHDLYRRAVGYAIREQNEIHARRPGRAEDAKTQMAAGAVSALLLLSGRSAVAAPASRAEDAVPAELLDGLAAEPHLQTALRSRLFRQTGHEGWEPAHRTIAEFLAASFLVDKVIRHGHPLGRMLALVCGDGEAPEPSLRGLFAWLVTLLPSRAEEIVGRDPYAVAIYGDLAALRPAGRLALLRGLRRLADTEPFFRAGHWGEGRLGALAIPELVEELRQILAARPVRIHLLACVLDALEDGEPRPELEADLATLISDPVVDADFRSRAVSAFVRSASGDAAVALFASLLADDQADPHAAICGRLLLAIYPDRLTVADLDAFLDRYVSTDGEQADRLHLSFRLARLIPEEQEAEIMDRISARAWPIGRGSPASRSRELKLLVRELAGRALVRPDNTPASRVIAWLPSMMQDGMGRDGSEKLTMAFGDRPELYVPFLLAIADHDDIRMQSAHPIWQLRRCLPEFGPPDDAEDRILDHIEADPDAPAALMLYACASALIVGKASPDHKNFSRFWGIGNCRQILAGKRRELLVSSLVGQEWRKEDREQQAQLMQQEAERVSKNVTSLLFRIDSIRDGTDANALTFLALEWFDHMNSRRDVTSSDPLERLLETYPKTIAEAAICGFTAYTTNGPALDPTTLAEQAVANQHPCVDYIALAGADLIFEQEGRLPGTVSTEQCVGLLCLGLALQTFTRIGNVTSADRRPWLHHVVQELPEESMAAIRRFLIPQIRNGLDHVLGLHKVCTEDGFAAIRRDVATDLFAIVEPSGSAFETLWRTVLKECDLAIVSAIVEARVHDVPSGSGPDGWPWLLLAWRFKPEIYGPRFRDELRGDEKLLVKLYHELPGDYGPPRSLVGPPLTAHHRDTIIRMFGPRFPPVPVPKQSWNPPAAYDYASLVSRQIAALGDMPGGEVEAILRSLLAEPDLAAYADDIRHASSAWARNTRLARRERPSLDRLVRSLAGGAPATGAELRDFVVAHVEELKTTTRTASGDLWIAFWNVDAGPVPREARPENVCRDAVMQFLGGRFTLAGLGQEAEARQVGDTRCDIVVHGIDRIIPIEVKCDWNSQLWTGWEDQLQDQYAIDPRAAGFGIYLVLWFGERRGSGRRVPRSPSGEVPASAPDCERLLHTSMAERAGRLRAVVVDVSPV